MINYNNKKKFGQTVSLNFNFAYVEMFYIEEIIESTTQDKVQPLYRNNIQRK